MDERGRFEKWASGQALDLRREEFMPQIYWNPGVQQRWEVWQASLAERDARVEEMRLVLQNLVTVINSVAELDDNVMYFNGRYCGPLQNPLAEAERVLAQTAPTAAAIRALAEAERV